jgi:hypothetical protein
MNHGPKSDRDNHSNQCNPNNDEYWHCREYSSLKSSTKGIS